MVPRLLAAAVLAFVLAVPASAGADVKSRRDAGGARGGGAALDIARVTAAGNSAGLAVTVRMKGNFERAVGRGRLRHAALALVLRPRSRSARPSILATTGPSSDPDALERTRSRSTAVARRGRTVDFVIVGGGLDQVGRIQVKAFRRLPARRGRARSSDDIRISEAQARFILGETGGDAATVGVPATDDDCEELRATARALKGELDRLRAELGRHPSGPGRRALNEAVDLFSRLHEDTLAELVRRCGARLRAVCGGYRHLQPGKSRVSADFEYDVAFDDRIFIANFVFEYLDPATGQYTEPERQAGDRTEIVRLAANRRRIQRDIHQVGRYRITFSVRVRDVEDRVSIEVDVPPSPPETGGQCPPGA
ncbi:MAG TPA: hypothetical protein VHG69_03050 [Thermoleophilaceae bacterium]|nr:hypothetical protein [Thermoleophilaceae bacterium]